jgi:hypothetical protein
MAAVTSSASRVTLAAFSLLKLVEGSNITGAPPNSTLNYIAWHNGPAERGTTNIIWSCLTTVVAVLGQFFTSMSLALKTVYGPSSGERRNGCRSLWCFRNSYLPKRCVNCKWLWTTCMLSATRRRNLDGRLYAVAVYGCYISCYILGISLEST